MVFKSNSCICFHALICWKCSLFPWVCFQRLAAAATSLQSCPTLCDPIDGSPPGSPVSGILQARTLEWVAISSSNAWKWKVKVKSLSRARLFVIPWTTAYQAPPPMGLFRQENWSGLPLPSLFKGLKLWKNNRKAWRNSRHVFNTVVVKSPSHVWLFCNPMDCSLPGSSVLGKNTTVHCYCFLQGIFQTQGLSRRLLHWQVDSLPLSHQGSPTFNRRDNTQ